MHVAWSIFRSTREWRRRVGVERFGVLKLRKLLKFRSARMGKNCPLARVGHVWGTRRQCVAWLQWSAKPRAPSNNKKVSSLLAQPGLCSGSASVCLVGRCVRLPRAYRLSHFPSVCSRANRPPHWSLRRWPTRQNSFTFGTAETMLCASLARTMPYPKCSKSTGGRHER